MGQTHLYSFDRLPPGERVQEYLRRAGKYQELSRTATTAGARLLFHEMARDMMERASAVTDWAADKPNKKRQ
ncbi:hypothetical protein [Rhodoplanes sp. Z2-YC6860]|uniref:hypothetical protein n=1 Tax=Rhodoplanes sp. Z2-YC6860 TaxID=674703 RepID=UPI0012EEDFA3|nr:hypothetical protein [Rhodoplanes sp. Z2-YC6860]